MDNNNSPVSRMPALFKTPVRPGARNSPPSQSTPQRDYRTPLRENVERDRYIPARSAVGQGVARFNFLRASQEAAMAHSDITTPLKEGYKRQLEEAYFDASGSPTSPVRILAFKSKPPVASESIHTLLHRKLFSSLSLGPSPPRTGSQLARGGASAPYPNPQILDAPELRDDFYLNVMDWSANNVLALGLGATCYLWNATSGSVSELMTLEDEDDYISSVSWAPDGRHLAVGLASSEVQIWEASPAKQKRRMAGHSARVGCMAWNSGSHNYASKHLLSTGSRDTSILHHDVRVRQHLITRSAGHTREVCALRWSPSGRQLASGGNDNCVLIWDARCSSSSSAAAAASAASSASSSASSTSFGSSSYASSSSSSRSSAGLEPNLASETAGSGSSSSSNRPSSSSSTGERWGSDDAPALAFASTSPSSILPPPPPPAAHSRFPPATLQLASGGAGRAPAVSTELLHTLTDHEAAVKALAWCPFQSNVVASGGGTTDGRIIVWNSMTGAALKSVRTHSQISGLVWSKHKRELLSTHGLPRNEINIWQYPTLVKLSELTGHTSRILHLAQSPDGESITTAGADETLRFWKVFSCPEKRPAEAARPGGGSLRSQSRCIR
eukprot:jgi/Mesen1/6899/ME000353S05923